MAQIPSAEIEYNGPVIQVSVEGSGPPGPKGDDGVSPFVNTEEIENGTKVSITDAFGTKEFEVLNGKPGAEGTPGKPGDPGADGFSPTVSVEQTDTGVQISVTDKSGTTTATVEKGAPGKDGVDGVSPSVKVEQTDEGATITAIDSDGTTTATVKNGTPGTDGVDGGYYAPSLSEDGELNWTASKTGMPEIPSTNIKGPAGLGVPAPTPDTVGMVPVVNEAGDGYVFTNKRSSIPSYDAPQIDITIEEPCRDVQVDMLNGKPLSSFKYTYLFIYVENVVSEENITSELTVSVSNSGTILSAGTSFVHMTSKKYWTGFIDISCGIALSGTPNGAPTWRNTTSLMCSPTNRVVKDPYISDVLIRSVATDLPPGTIIKGWLL